MCEELPSQVKYWLTASSKHDCVFLVGYEGGTVERIGAFKVLLAGHSEPLRNMLEDSDISEQGDVRLVDVEPRTFKIFLTCVYGSADCNSLVESLSFEECVSLLYVVEKYLVNTIRPKIISHMLQLLHFETCSKKCDAIFLAFSSRVCFENTQLREYILYVVKLNIETIFYDDRFLHLTDEGLLEIVKLDVLNTSEINIWNALCKWAEFNVNSNDGKIIRKKILKHLKFIRFCALDLNTFCKQVVSKDILTPEEVYEIIKSFDDSYKLSPNMEHISTIVTPRSEIIPEIKNKNKVAFSDIKNNIKQLSQIEHHLNTFKYKDFTWNVMIRKQHNHLAVFLVCKSVIEDQNHSCSVDAELVLVNQGGEPNFSRHILHTFNHKQPDWGFFSFYSWNDLVNPDSGFVKDDTLIIMACLKNHVNDK